MEELSIVTKLEIQIGSIVKLHIQSKSEICGSHRSGMTFIQNFVTSENCDFHMIVTKLGIYT